MTEEVWWVFDTRIDQHLSPGDENIKQSLIQHHNLDIFDEENPLVIRVVFGGESLV